jgi:acid-sensing ion channel, other
LRIYGSIIASNCTGLDTEFEYNELEFPTVSVCPVNFVGGENDTFDTNDDSSNGYANHIELLMSPAISDEYDKDNGQTTLREVVFNLALSCEEVVYGCSFRGFKFPCCNHFQPVYSEQGFCYSFNARYIGAAINE